MDDIDELQALVYQPEPAQLTELRSYWEFAAISQFMSLFGSVISIEEFETETLESQMLNPARDPALIETMAKMMRMATLNRFITPETWLHYLDREFDRREITDRPIREGDDFFALPIRKKVELLHFLCEGLFDNPDRMRALLKDEEDDAVEWRVEPIGYDAKGNKFWMFDDNRLYMEVTNKTDKSNKKSGDSAPARRGKAGSSSITTDQPPINSRSGNGSWQLVCLTPEDWQTFPDRFKNSKDQQEKALYTFLTEHAIPMVLQDIEARRARKLEAVTKKRSSRLKLLEESDAFYEINRKSTLRSSARSTTPGGSRGTPEVKLEETRSGRKELRDRKIKERQEAEEMEIILEQQRAAMEAEEAKRKVKEEIDREEERKEKEIQRALQAELRKEEKLKKQKAQEERQREIDQLSKLSPNATKRKTRHEVNYAQNGDDENVVEASSTTSTSATSTGSRRKSQPVKSLKQQPPKPSVPAYALQVVVGGSDDTAPSDPNVPEPWYFSCLCGVKGNNLDDGTAMICCEVCNVWSHLECIAAHGNKKRGPANQLDVAAWQASQFVCNACAKKEKKAAKNHAVDEVESTRNQVPSALSRSGRAVKLPGWLSKDAPQAGDVELSPKRSRSKSSRSTHGMEPSPKKLKSKVDREEYESPSSSSIPSPHAVNGYFAAASMRPGYIQPLSPMYSSPRPQQPQGHIQAPPYTNGFNMLEQPYYSNNGVYASPRQREHLIDESPLALLSTVAFSRPALPALDSPVQNGVSPYNQSEETVNLPTEVNHSDVQHVSELVNSSVSRTDEGIVSKDNGNMMDTKDIRSREAPAENAVNVNGVLNHALL
ncbi:hypothetical protein SmJEL517_g00543 [Synchytrium microbalum]|uniref:Zinc finger PHD-type domain-containing protein n=1 Tax=Synchytrium microbalum TaxID=1806994 RepID=A0A507CD00_9FUNG|nr:uncharacterized protein SmJEL517_g00543 [Synchytrium microbalum]TPX37492.1 hypothetical protein SmJEL517_g00543 [Synchytrium microbalum]